MSTLSKAGALTLLSVACLTIMVGCVMCTGSAIDCRASWCRPHARLADNAAFTGSGDFRPGYRQANRKVWTLPITLCRAVFLWFNRGERGLYARGRDGVCRRLLLGAAAAVVMSTGTGLISAFYHGENRLRMIARQGMSIELGGVIFLFIGGLLATTGWRWPFSLYFFAWICWQWYWLLCQLGQDVICRRRG